MERAAQLQTRKELRQHQQDEEKLFAELWEADRQAKEERESQQLQRQQHKNMEQMDLLRTQIETAEQQRQQAKQLKEEEARLLVCIVVIFFVVRKESIRYGKLCCTFVFFCACKLEQREMLCLEKQREQQQKLQAQEKWRRQLDQCLRLKMKRLAREQQDELALDMSILQLLLEHETDEKQEAAQRKVGCYKSDKSDFSPPI